MSTRYVDSAVASSGNGQSWSSAWKGIANITGLVAGDTVYFSGGPKGSSGKSYSLPGEGWAPIRGTSANRITYQIGQEDAHKGIATFTGSGAFLKGNLSGVTVSGDAGDGARHFKVGSLGATTAVDCGSGTDGFSLSYVDFGQKSKSMFGGNPIQHYQIDHCFYHKLPDSSHDNVIWTKMNPGLDFDNSTISFCELHAPHRPNVKPDGYGDDFIGPTIYSGLTVHDTKFISYPATTYPAGQHHDGWQALAGDHLKCYNNYYENLTSYPFYGDAFYGGFEKIFVFNNIIVLTDPEVQGEDSPQGLIVASEMDNAPFNDVVVAHNLIADYTWHKGTVVGNGGSGSIAFGDNIGLWNNLATNNGSVENGHPVFGEEGNPKVANIHNVNLKPLPTGAGIFADYKENHADTADFHLVAEATSLIGKGTNLSAQAANCPELMKDRDGKPRPASGNWDIGPYQFVSGGTPVPIPPEPEPIPPEPIPPEPVPTPNTFGVTTVYPTVDSGNAGLICAQKASLDADATLQSLAFYVASPSGTLRLGLYDASGAGGNPGKKLAETASTVAFKGWNTLNVVSPVALKAGSYWLAYEVSDNACSFAVDRSSGALVVANLVYGTLPATFPSNPRGERANWSFYGNLSNPGPTPPPDSASGKPQWKPTVGYNLYYGSSPRNLTNKVVVSGCAASTVQIDGLVAGTTYHYQVCPVDDAGVEGAKSATATFVAE